MQWNLLLRQIGDSWQTWGDADREAFQRALAPIAEFYAVLNAQRAVSAHPRKRGRSGKMTGSMTASAKGPVTGHSQRGNGSKNRPK